eukprot:PhF_6_TR39975/c0_g1_i2/m.59339
MGCTLDKPRDYVVHLNVYNLVPQGFNALLQVVGVGGAYHTAVEIDGYEYAFGEDGVTRRNAVDPNNPDPPHGMKFLQKMEVGIANLTPHQLQRYIENAVNAFPGIKYDLLSCNCNHFSDAFVRGLKLPPIPKEINQLSNVGRAVLTTVSENMQKRRESERHHHHNHQNPGQ